MSAVRAGFECTACGYQASQWRGRCPQCGAWESLMQALPAARPRSLAAGAAARATASQAGRSARPVALGDIAAADHRRLTTGIGELDRVLGGGLVRGSVVLLAGEPGAGKSTLSLQAAAGLEASAHSVLLVCGEEAVEQVAARAQRVGGSTTAHAFAGTDLAQVLAASEGFDAVVIDSIQTLSDPELSGEAGSVTQVRGCASALAQHARATGTALLLVGHVTKDGSVAGPRVLEHLVDAVLTFEGDRGQRLRLLRTVKNRFGTTAELGVFEMGPGGLTEITDASRLFLADRRPGVPGTAVGCLMEGRRPVAVEIQALVIGNEGNVRRVAQGFERERLDVAAAVLEQRAATPLSRFDLFARVAGGLRADEPSIDLALALALTSARRDQAVPADLVAIGEVGLAGDVRTVPGMRERLRECARLGFRRAVVGRSSADEASAAVTDAARGGRSQAAGELSVTLVGELREAIALLDKPGHRPPDRVPERG